MLFGVYYTIIAIRKPQSPVLLIKGPYINILQGPWGARGLGLKLELLGISFVTKTNKRRPSPADLKRKTL